MCIWLWWILTIDLAGHPSESCRSPRCPRRTRCWDSTTRCPPHPSTTTPHPSGRSRTGWRGASRGPCPPTLWGLHISCPSTILQPRQLCSQDQECCQGWEGCQDCQGCHCQGTISRHSWSLTNKAMEIWSNTFRGELHSYLQPVSTYFITTSD